MPKRTKNALPTPKVVNGTQLAAYFDGKRKTFGNVNNPESWEKYHAFLRNNVFPKSTPESPDGGVLSQNATLNTSREISEVGKMPAPVPLPTQPAQAAHSDGGTTVGDLVTEFLEDAIQTKGRSDYVNFKTACQALYQHSGELPTSAFDAYLLLQIQDRFCRAGYARTHCNRLVNYIIHIFKWGGVRRLAPAAKYLELKAIPPVPYGKAKENPPREDVPDPTVASTLRYCTPTLAAMIQVGRMTGMRPEELCLMVVGNIERPEGSDLWYYRLDKHKTVKKVGKRIIPLGKPEQELIAPYLKGKKPGNAIFSPRTSERERHLEQRANRKTPMVPSQIARDKRNAKKPPVIGEFYCPDSYRRAVTYAINRANRNGEHVENWTPYQLRHSAASEARKKYGRDGAKALLGHVSGDVTDRYTHEWQLELCEKMARERVNPFAKVG